MFPCNSELIFCLVFWVLFFPLHFLVCSFSAHVRWMGPSLQGGVEISEPYVNPMRSLVILASHNVTTRLVCEHLQHHEPV